MLANLSKIKFYNPSHDFIVYFVPTFLVLMFGYFSLYDSVNTTVSMVLKLNYFLEVFVLFTILTTLGKVIYELTAYFLRICEVLIYSFLAFLGKVKVFAKIHTFLQSLIES